MGLSLRLYVQTSGLRDKPRAMLRRIGRYMVLAFELKQILYGVSALYG